MGLAARKPDNTAWDLLITPNAQNPQVPQSSTPDQPINYTDTVEFTNNTSFPVSIVFTKTSGIVFTDIPSLAPNGATSTAQSPQMTNVTVNYTITNLNANQTSSPCAIQVGVGPLRINILASDTNSDPVSIPNGGQIQFRPDVAYQLKITPPNAFNPSPSSISPTNSPALTATNLAPKATYTVTNNLKDTRGGGTVHIGS